MEVTLANYSQPSNGIDANTTTATIKCPSHAQAVVVECTADSTFTCTVSAQFKDGGSYRNVPCLQSDGGTFSQIAAGGTITLTSGDLLFIACPGAYQVRVSRAGGTATVVMTATSAGMDALVAMMSAGGGLSSEIVGNIAHDTADSGKPVKIGFKAETALSGVTLVADGDRVDGIAGVDGVQIVREHCNLEDIVTGTLTNTDGASTSLIASSGAGVKTYLTMLDLYNSSATGVVVELKDGTTVKKTFYVPATGGLIRKFEPPLAGTAATAWNIDAAGATTTLYANAEGFKSKV